MMRHTPCWHQSSVSIHICNKYTYIHYIYICVCACIYIIRVCLHTVHILTFAGRILKGLHMMCLAQLPSNE